MLSKDPVCGMQIDAQAPATKMTYEGQTYYFCTIYCKKKFEIDPPRYVPKDGKTNANEE